MHRQQRSGRGICRQVILAQPHGIGQLHGAIVIYPEAFCVHAIEIGALTKSLRNAEALSIVLGSLLLRCSFCLRVLAAEALDAACGVHQLLLAREERVTA